jgi:ABC-type transport system substrate-binding protein
VLVTFSRPYPGWRSLFTNLLPAHLLRDAPAGWGQALNSGYPASGGPFEIAQVDRARGVITLERNDRYWGAPAVSDRIVLRASNQAGQVAALASGSSNLAMFTANASTMARLRAIGKTVRLSTLPQPVTTQLLLRPSSSQLSDVRVRQAVAAALDRNALVNAGTGGGPGARLQDQALTLAPSQPGYVPTMPSALAAPNPASVKRLLTAAGYQFVGGAWVRDGRSLGLVIAAPFERQNYVNIANAAAQQLDQQGIQATVVTPTSDQLFNQMLSPNSSAAGTGQVSPDMVVTPGLVGGDPAATLAASYGCPGVTPGQNPEPSNPAGFCDELLQPTLEAALSGQISFRQESARVEPFLWSQAVALPLYQQSATVAVRQGVTGVQFGPGFTGPFFSAAQWHGLPNNNAGY